MPTPTGEIMQEKELDTFYPKNVAEWRKWLEEHHESKQSIWLVAYSKKSGVPSITWSESVDVALCFGWIDSTRKSIGEGKSIQFFTKRRPKSNWSKINKEKVRRLIEQGLMTKAGYESIETAKRNGSWNALDDVEELIIPEDLEKEFEKRPGSKEFFLSISKSGRKIILHWISSAKRAETREKRITEIAESSAKKQKPKQL